MKKSFRKQYGQKKTRNNALSILILTLIVCSSSYLFAKDEVKGSVKENLKKVKGEAKIVANEKNEEAKTILEALFLNGTLTTYSDDYLPKEDRGKTFDAKLAAEKTDKQNLSPFEASLQEVIDSSLRTEELEGSEDFLISSEMVMENSQKGLGIISSEENLIPEEKNIETCQEGGSFIKTIDKERTVTILPRRTEDVRICLGHKKEKTFFWESDAKKQVEKWKTKLAKDKSLKTWDVHIDSGGIFFNYHVIKKWVHKEDVICTKHRIETKVLQDEKEIDHWETTDDQKQVLKSLEGNLNCRLIQTQEFHPGERTISGKGIYRDSWNQRLIFSCQPEAESKCLRLREAGGVLLKRICLREDDYGDCLSWEKTYDLGGTAAYSTQKVIFEEEDLFDLDDFDPSYEKNTEFASVISTLGALENMEKSISEDEFDPERADIFSGHSSKCRRTFGAKNIFDCCHKRDCEGGGLFIDLDLGRCNKEERDLFEKVQEGKCHRIGTVKNLITTEHVYCCFPTKLARIIQEEGHKQLGISWGGPKEPNCNGLTLIQLQSLDFERMDFADFIEEIQDKIDSQTLANKLKSLAQSFSNALSEEAVKAKTEEKTELSIDKIKQFGEGL